MECYLESSRAKEKLGCPEKPFPKLISTILPLSSNLKLYHVPALHNIIFPLKPCFTLLSRRLPTIVRNKILELYNFRFYKIANKIRVNFACRVLSSSSGSNCPCAHFFFPRGEKRN